MKTATTIRALEFLTEHLYLQQLEAAHTHQFFDEMLIRVRRRIRDDVTPAERQIWLRAADFLVRKTAVLQRLAVALENNRLHYQTQLRRLTDGPRH